MFNIFKYSIRNPTSAPLCSISRLCSSTKAAPGQRVSIPRKTARLRLYNGTEAKAHASYTVWGNVPSVSCRCGIAQWMDFTKSTGRVNWFPLIRAKSKRPSSEQHTQQHQDMPHLARAVDISHPGSARLVLSPARPLWSTPYWSKVKAS